MLIEMTVALTLLVTVGMVVFKSSIDLIAPRQSVLHQNVSDAYMTYEEAYAARVSFEELTSTASGSPSPWPLYPAVSEFEVEIGKLPGGRPITGTITRTRMPDPNNLPAAGGTGTLSTNPAEMETWKLESHLEYQIGDQTYLKSRTTVRTQ